MSINEKTKILLCSPPPGSSGGISRWAEHIRNYYDKIEDKHLDLIFFPMPRKHFVAYMSTLKRVFLGLDDYLSIYKSYKQMIKNEKPDISHIVSSASLGLFKDILLIKASNRKNIQTIVHFHFGRIPDLCIKQNWEYKLLCKVLRLANRVVVIDKQSFDALKDRGFTNIDLLPNPLAPSVTQFVQENGNTIKKEERKIVFIGQVLKTKGVFELLEACKTIPNIKLKMLGYVNDEMKNELFDSLDADNNSWVEICGNQDYNVVLNEMLSAGVFVLPTYTEGFPNVILESMACGCPIVTTKVGAIPEMLDIENGFNNGITVEPKDVGALREAIEKMLNDREYALKCGVNAQTRVNKLYSMPRVWGQLESIWFNVKS